MKKWIRITAALIAALACQGPSLAQDFPAKKIDLIVPFSAGSGIDVIARIYNEALQSILGVPVIIDNREGAAGVVGTQAAMRAVKDGYAMVMAANPPFTVAPLLQASPPYDPLTSFTPIARVGAVPLVLVVSPQLPIRNFQELKDYAAANQDKAFFSAPGAGSPAQIYMNLIKKASGLKVEEVMYKSATQPMTDISSAVVLTSLISLPAAAPLIEAGKLRAIAIGSGRRLAKLADVPTLAEALGQPGFTAEVWFGFLAPAGTPRDRVERLHGAIAKAFSMPEVQERMSRASLVAELLGPEEFAKHLRVDLANSRKVLGKD